MVSLVTKRIKGNEYLYLVDSERIGTKVRQKTIKYVGKKRPVPDEEFQCMKRSYLDEDWVLTGHRDRLPYAEHARLRAASESQTEHLLQLDPLSQEKRRDRFLSLFIANSNSIEGSTMTPDDTFRYLFDNVVPTGKSKKELFMATNLLKAWEYMEERRTDEPSHEHLKALHALVNDQIERTDTLGTYKPVQNYVGQSLTTSYLFVEEKMERLLEWVRSASSEMDEFEIAFQSHAQFEIIHPFVDGNGRVGRLLLNWLLLRSDLQPLAILAQDRERYLSALENSARGELAAICRFCADQYLAQYSFV